MLNIDRSWNPNLKVMDYGRVVRDIVGRWKCGFMNSFGGGDPLCVELLALEARLHFCREVGFKFLICNLDCIIVVSKLQKNPQYDYMRHKHVNVIANVLNHDWKMYFDSVPMEVNVVAHGLAN
ncbi:hypothetical protein Fmac_014670 [Flemingia macrophylla]|uniref:RNase H type-1 domain-containing protein n=1 Tax=Flemingia macrophylla TaxID=520843 RepID=A0ABD1MCI6_9FABA